MQWEGTQSYTDTEPEPEERWKQTISKLLRAARISSWLNLNYLLYCSGGGEEDENQKLSLVASIS